jgi:hypothetical protein
MEVIKAQPVHNLDDDDDEKYKISLSSRKLNGGRLILYISIFNTKLGLTFNTEIEKGSEWYNNNKNIYRDDWKQLYNILKKSLINKDKNLNYTINESQLNFGSGTIILKIIYDNDMFPFNLIIDVPRYISDKGELEDRINSLEYQVERLRNKLNNKTMKINSEKINDIEEIYNKYGHLVYKGQMKNGKPHGKGIKYLEDAEVIQYEGEFKNGLYDGYGVLRANGLGNGRKPSSGDYVGNFCKGLMNGEIFNERSGNKYYTNYKMGFQEGLSKHMNKDGSVHTLNYKDDIQYGEWKLVDKDGKIISSGVAK